MSRTAANVILLLAAAIWGSAFVAQSLAMTVMDPLWYTGVRFLLASVAILPFAVAEWRAAGKPVAASVWRVVAVICVVMCGASLLQQVAMKTATATNAGFLTSLYVLFTPIVGILLYRERPQPIVWFGAGLGLAGTYLLGGGLTGFTPGDGMIVVTAACWALLIVLIGRVVQTAGHPIGIAFAQNAFTGVVCTALAVPFADPPAFSETAVWTILYGGLLSGGIAYTFQAIGQRHTTASNAAIILASEAPFAALAGALVLGERVTLLGASGCALIFGAILLVQLWPAPRETPAAA